MATARPSREPYPTVIDAERLKELRAMTPEEIQRNAEDDPDNPPMTEEDANALAASVRLQRLRKKMGLSQTAFASRYRIGLARLRDWEQGRSRPDEVASAYLTLIARDPDFVDRALASEPAE